MNNALASYSSVDTVFSAVLVTTMMVGGAVLVVAQVVQAVLA